MPNLVGIGNSQVPTNAMLGGMAYQESNNVVIDSLEPGNLSKIITSLKVSNARRYIKFKSERRKQ